MNKDRSSLWSSLIVIFLVCGVTFLSVKESKKDETWKEEQDWKEAKVYEAMDSYTEELSRILRNDGLEDIEVVWTECTSEEYTEKYGFAPSYCTYFFSVDYYCDEIEKICENYLKDDDEENLIELLRKCCKDKQSYVVDDHDRSISVRFDKGGVNIGINDGMSSNQLLLKISEGQEYFIDASEMGTWVYKNGKHLVNIQNPVPEDNKEEETNFTYIPSYKKNKHNTDNYKGTYYDPYGVENYDNPDSFAEEMAEEFGDGDFEDGYDDAYDYWEEEYE